MRKAVRISLVASLFMLPSCSDDGLPTDLPLVVTESSRQGTVQVTVDPEGTVLTNRGGETTRTDVTDQDITTLRSLIEDADLDDFASGSSTNPRYVILAGDVEIFLGPNDVPEQVVPLLEWIKKHRA